MYIEFVTFVIDSSFGLYAFQTSLSEGITSLLKVVDFLFRTD